jgi:hypothetical protein
VRRSSIRYARRTAPPNLHHPVKLTLLRQSSGACRAAFLRAPCFKGLVEFTAPYAVNSAAADYGIEGFAKCRVGGRPETGWRFDRDVRAHELIRTESLGLFTLTPSCLAKEGFEVRYEPAFDAPSPRRGPVIIGSVKLSEAQNASG